MPCEINIRAKVIKYAAPIAGATAGYAKKVAGELKLMEELAGWLKEYRGSELLERVGGGGKAERIEGAALRVLRELLDEVDKEDYWGGLGKILTPEGHYLWVCEEHAKEYRV